MILLFTSATDFILAPVMLLTILLFTRFYVASKVKMYPEYKYFFTGMTLKMMGSIGLWGVYTFYYSGGDTFQYYDTAIITNDLFFENAKSFFTIWLGEYDIRKYFLFRDVGSYPPYYKDPNTFFVVRMIIPLVFFSFRSYLVCAFYLTTLSFFGIWKLYQVFISEYPALKNKFAIAIFCIPSVFFWGSGILKDTITFSMVSLYISAFYKVFIKRKNVFGNVVWLIVASLIIVSIKPYIFIGLLPGSLFWIMNKVLSSIKGKLLRFVSAPALLTLVVLFGYVLLNSLESTLGTYSLKNVLTKAMEVQHDLKSDYYNGNSFDIGEFNTDFSSMLIKAPAAINVALFRPYIWESNNIVMFLSSIENLIILLFTIRVLIKTKLIFWTKYLPTNHLLTFSIIFSLFFAFSVGISSSNFGSMVRYKIPAIPFFVCSLFIVEYLHTEEVKNRKKRLIKNSPAEVKKIS